MATRGVCVLAGRMADTVEIAAAADAAGYDAAWTSEFNDRSAIVAMAAMAHNTSKCRIGSAIAYAVGRSPLILANEARGLDEISGGRLVLGLGTGHEGHADRLARRQGSRVARAAARGARSAAAPHLEAARWTCPARGPLLLDEPHPDRRGPPARPRADPDLHRGGQPADDRDGRSRVRRAGLPSHLQLALRPRGGPARPSPDGAERTGRDPAAVEIVGMLLCSVHEDEEIARRELAGAARLLRRTQSVRADARGQRLRRRGRPDPQGVRRP